MLYRQIAKKKDVETDECGGVDSDSTDRFDRETMNATTLAR